MPDDINAQQEQQDAEGAVPDMTSPDFDWDAFWGSPAPAVEEPVVQVESGDVEDIEDELEDERDKELAQLRKQTELNARQLAELQTQQRLDASIEEWKKQASPAELAFSDLLYESQSLDELKRNAARVKKAAAKADELFGEELKKREGQMTRQMQEQFGLPVPPSFQPIPQADKASQALAEGDLDQAAAIMLEGLF